VYQILAEDIRALGVECIFGLISDDTADLISALDSLGIPIVGARHENNAVAMADGYAHACGRLAVAIIGRGPATANCLHATVSTSRTGSPILVIFGDAPSGSFANPIGPDYKRLDADGVLGAAGVRCFTATGADTARSALADAVAAANQGTLAALLLPTNVLNAKGEASGAPLAASPTRSPQPARAQSIATAAALLEKSRRPVILAGRGAHKAGARQALERLAGKTGALLITSMLGKDMFRGSPYALGILGSFSHSLGRRMVGQADCVVAFGAGLNFLTMSFGASLPAVPLIHVDQERSHIGRWSAADVAVVGDARVVAEQLAAALPDRPASAKPFHSKETLTAIAEFDLSRDFIAANTERTLDARTLGLALDKILPADRHVVYDAGNFLSIVPYLGVPNPGRVKMTNEFASIGMGFGTALGVSRGARDATTVLVIGDGGFLMTIGELETVVREDLPLTIIVMNDCAYGAELHLLRAHGLSPHISQYPDVDYAPIAQSLGFEAATVRTLDDLRAAAPLLAKAREPVLIDCKLNAEVAAPFTGEFAEYAARTSKP
jgi:thiamine pyrophosphate-dependent acetolactate synthase large subunit-like protein